MKNEIELINNNGQILADSRNIAEVTGKRHANLIRTIAKYEETLTNSKMSSLDFFVPDEYIDSKNEKRAMYWLTKKGCDMVANKMTGDKGILFTAAYVDKFYAMEKQLKQQKPMSQLEILAGATQALLQHEQQRQALQERAEASEQQLAEVNDKVVQIADAIAGREVKDSWRQDTASKINQIARSEGCTGDFRDDVKTVRHAIYAAVDRRCGVRLYTRLNHRKERMVEIGIAKTRISKLNIVDEIATDPKLIQAYTDVISDFMVAFPWPIDDSAMM